MKTAYLKKLCAEVVILSCTLPLLAGCGSEPTISEPIATMTLEPVATAAGESAIASDAPGPEKDNTTIHDLLSDWFDYLYINECGYGNDIWAADMVAAFASDPDWERLLAARMAVSAAALDLDERQLDPALLGK